MYVTLYMCIHVCILYVQQGYQFGDILYSTVLFCCSKIVDQIVKLQTKYIILIFNSICGEDYFVPWWLVSAAQSSLKTGTCHLLNEQQSQKV